MATRGRKKTTGRYETREELCREVWRMYLDTPRNISQVALVCRVSETIVRIIMDTKEGYPLTT